MTGIGRIFWRNMKNWQRIKRAGLLLGMCLLILCGCGNRKQKPGAEMEAWLERAELDDNYTKEELYEAALSEDTLVVYSVSSRVFQAKEAFEKEYPGLSVEIRDIRSGDVVNMLKENYRTGDFGCDVVLCSDCDGSLYKELIEPGILYTYIPWDIAPHIKEDCMEMELQFLGEAMLPFYNTDVFEKPPITNIWEMTEEAYRGKIMMASPLSSFSTYGFCAQIMQEEEALTKAYEEYAGEALILPDNQTAGEYFLEKLSDNLLFVNSNDEVLEGVGNSDDAWIGIMISSKFRYRDLGYHIMPVTRLAPFSAVYTPNSISLAGGAESINAAKLFIRYMLGETDGRAEGAEAFSTEGSWSVRTDMPDGSSIPMEEIDIIPMDEAYLYENRDRITAFFGSLLEKNRNLE